MTKIENTPTTRLKPKKTAEDSGLFDVIVADDFTLLLDLDSAADLSHWQNCCGRLEQYGIKASETEEWKSKSGNTHVRIRMEEPLSCREAGNKEQYEFPCMLFKPKTISTENL